MSKQLIIAGFHRSGTSMLAQELSNSGLFLGERMMPPSLANIDGYFEDMDIVNIHDAILRCNDTSWQHSKNIVFDIPNLARKKIEDISQKYTEAHTQWGFKDPRSALFLNIWHKTLENPYTILIYRDYNETSESLFHRESRSLLMHLNKSALRFWKEPELAYQMWLAYNRKLLDYAKNYPQTTIVISQKAILEGFPILEALHAQFGFDFNLDVETTVVKSRTRRSVGTVMRLPDSLQNELDEVWQELQRLSIAPVKEIEKKPLVKTEKDHTYKDIEKSAHFLVGAPPAGDRVANTIHKLASNGYRYKEKMQLIGQSVSLFSALGQIEHLVNAVENCLDKSVDTYSEAYLRTQGDIYRQMGNYEKAEYFYLLIFSFADPLHPYHFNVLAVLYLEMSLLDKADMLLQKAIKGNPNNPSFYLTKASLAIRKCDYIGALTAYDNAIEKSENSMFIVDVLLRKSIIYELFDEPAQLQLTLKKLDTIVENVSDIPIAVQNKIEALKHKKSVRYEDTKKQWLDESKTFLSRYDRGRLLYYLIDGIDDAIAKQDLTNRLAMHLETLKTLHINYKPKIDFHHLPLCKDNTEIKQFTIAVIIHLFYEDLLEEIIHHVNFITPRPDLYISVSEDVNIQKVELFLVSQGYKNYTVEVCHNRGRDIAPFLVDFSEKLQTYDLCCKIHGKKSLFMGNEQQQWRNHLLDNLLKSKEHVRDIICKFFEDETLGLLFSDSDKSIPHHCFSWLHNKPIVPSILKQLNLLELENLLDEERIDFPAGTMFWFRPKAIKQLLNAGLEYHDFQEEPIPSDGTIAHVIERLFAYVARLNGYNFIELNQTLQRYSVNETHKNYMYDEGEKACKI